MEKKAVAKRLELTVRGGIPVMDKRDVKHNALMCLRGNIYCTNQYKTVPLEKSLEEHHN